jgi:hypothetical protein
MALIDESSFAPIPKTGLNNTVNARHYALYFQFQNHIKISKSSANPITSRTSFPARVLEMAEPKHFARDQTAMNRYGFHDKLLMIQRNWSDASIHLALLKRLKKHSGLF